MIYKTLSRKLKIEQHLPHKKRVNYCATELEEGPAPLVASVVSTILNNTFICFVLSVIISLVSV